MYNQILKNPFVGFANPFFCRDMVNLFLKFSKIPLLDLPALFFVVKW
jgi:hypothetical protein